MKGKKTPSPKRSSRRNNFAARVEEETRRLAARDPVVVAHEQRELEAEWHERELRRNRRRTVTRVIQIILGVLAFIVLMALQVGSQHEKDLDKQQATPLGKHGPWVPSVLRYH